MLPVAMEFAKIVCGKSGHSKSTFQKPECQTGQTFLVLTNDLSFLHLFTPHRDRGDGAARGDVVAGSGGGRTPLARCGTPAFSGWRRLSETGQTHARTTLGG